MVTRNGWHTFRAFLYIFLIRYALRGRTWLPTCQPCCTTLQTLAANGEQQMHLDYWAVGKEKMAWRFGFEHKSAATIAAAMLCCK